MFSDTVKPVVIFVGRMSQKGAKKDSLSWRSIMVHISRMVPGGMSPSAHSAFPCASQSDS